MTYLALIFTAVGASAAVVARRAFDREQLHSGVWAFAQQDTVGEVFEGFASLQGSTLFDGVECCRAYVQRNDSVFFRGYNRGRDESMLADSYVFAERLPRAVGQSVTSNFTGHGLLWAMLPFDESGSLTNEVIATGSCVIAPGDTIFNAILTKSVLECTRVYSATDSEDYSTVIYRWYANTSGLIPIAKQVENYVAGNASPISSTLITPFIEGDDSLGIDYIKNVIESAVVSINNGYISLSFSGNDVPIVVYLLDIMGNVYAVAEGSSAVGVDIPCGGCASGNYIVSIRSQSYPEVERKIVITL